MILIITLPNSGSFKLCSLLLPLIRHIYLFTHPRIIVTQSFFPFFTSEFGFVAGLRPAGKGPGVVVC